MAHRKRRGPRSPWFFFCSHNRRDSLARSRKLALEHLEPRQLLAADLVVDDVWTEPASVLVGESFRIKARIRNAGNDNANAGLFANQEAVFYLDGDQRGEGDDYDNLEPGETLVVQSPLVSVSTPGQHSIRAVADGNDEVDESNEGNNARTEPISVPGPDLIVEAIWTEPAIVVEGDDFRIKARIRNQGTVTANAGLFANQEAVFFLDGDQRGEGDDYDNLEPGETLVVQSPNITGPSPGDYSISVVADGNNEVAETLEHNNSRGSFITVEPKLSWRASADRSSDLVDDAIAGLTVYAHFYDVDRAGETVEVEVWEDDTTGIDVLGNDKIAELSLTLDDDGFGAASWKAAWQGADQDAPENQYYLRYDVPFSVFNVTSDPMSVSVAAEQGVHAFSAPLSYDWDGDGPGEETIDVALSRIDSISPIDPAARTWVVIHGRNGAFDGSSPVMQILSSAVVSASGADQVLTLDWSEGADSPLFTDFFGESWLLPVAQLTSRALTSFGLTTGLVNLIGHSWGGVISGELAGAFPGGVNTVIAIDPAEDAIPPFGAFYSTNNVVFGGDNSNYSWAFYSKDGLGGLAGNEGTPTTADEAFVVAESEHTIVVEAVATMIAAPVGTVSRFFSLERLLAGADGPWARNQYSHNGTLDPDSGDYEAVITTTNGGTAPASIEYVNAGPAAPAPGDYDRDGDVDGGDFLAWQRTRGATGANLPADGNFDDIVSHPDLRVWTANFGQATPPAVVAILSSEQPTFRGQFDLGRLAARLFASSPTRAAANQLTATSVELDRAIESLAPVRPRRGAYWAPGRELLNLIAPPTSGVDDQRDALSALEYDVAAEEMNTDGLVARWL